MSEIGFTDRMIASKLMDDAAKAVLRLHGEWKAGAWTMRRLRLTKQQVEFEKLRGAIGGAGKYGMVYDLEPGTYLVLDYKDQVMMSTTPMERRTNLEAVVQAQGDVLIGGLGLGLAALAIAAKRQVRQVLVVEKDQTLIDQVAPKLPKKITVVCGDVLAQPTLATTKFDVAWLDIWPEISSDNWADMKLLRRRFQPMVRGWLGMWQEREVKRLAAEARAADRLTEMFRRMRA